MGQAESTKPKIQSVCLPDLEPKEGWGPIYRSTEGRDALVSSIYDDVPTLYHNFLRGATRYPGSPCLGTRSLQSDGKRGDYYWQSYSTVQKRVLNFGSGLLNYGLEKGNHLGIYSINRAEWVIAEQACYSQGLIPISLYDTLGPDAVAYIIQQADITTIVASKDKIQKILDVKDQCPNLAMIIQMEKEGDKAIQDLAAEKGVKLLSFSEVEDKGCFFVNDPNPPEADDLATIMYTSGTTGNPKGVMLSHRNVVSMMSAGIMMGIRIYNTDVHISYLPLAHIFERAVQAIVYCNGGSVGFYQGEVTKLTEDIMELKPTIFPSVPRLFNRLYDKARATVDGAGGIKKFLFDWGFDSKRKRLDEGGEPTNALWDKLVFDKMRAKLGGRVRLIVTGSAPISKEVYQFLQVCFCVPVLQGYGLTETSAAATLTLPWDFTVGHVGPPLPCCEVRLCDVPEMNYLSTNDPPQGEVCIRGNNVFQGYYKMPEKTAEDKDEDGWFHSGDVGQWNPNGTLTIIDRKKNIFKLAQGEYVAAEVVEGVYLKNKFVQQIFAYGDSLQACLVGIVVPDFEVLGPWAAEQGMKFEGDDPHAAMCASEDIKAMYQEELNRTGKDMGLKGFEFVKAIHLEHEPFSVENDLLTPTFKPKRPQLKERYQATVEALYESLRK